jgi:N-carbamoylputrescine amidase
MSRKVKLAAIQCPLGDDRDTNVARIEKHVLAAAAKGAQIILPPELFEGPYFCRTEEEHFFSWARPVQGNPTIARFQALAKELKVVIPVSFFEKDGPHYYNSVAMIDERGELLGTYRKSHIPDGPGYEEKYYFRPGNTGFKVWDTAYGKIGVGICWDQWFPECARAMALQGAEILLYPTAIGSEPQQADLDTKDPWQRVMVGHAVANVTPVVAANRIGNEQGQVFYGHSFIANHQGSFLAEMGRTDEGVLVAEVDLAEVETYRAAFGFFRDRRVELYGPLTER